MEELYTPGEDDTFGRTKPPPQGPEHSSSVEEVHASAAECDDNLAWQVAEHKDEDAANKLFERYLDLIYYYFLKRTASIPETQDLTGDTFLRAIEGLRSRTWQGQPFRPWLFVIAKHVYLEWRRRQTRKLSAHHTQPHMKIQGERTDADKLPNEVIAKEQAATLWRLVGELPALDQQVLILRFFSGLSHKEAAQQIGCTPHACKTRQNRALRKLREKILQAGLGKEFGIDTS